ncbi:MAG: vWA domain-containing protein [Myxococcota bacterium]
MRTPPTSAATILTSAGSNASASATCFIATAATFLLACSSDGPELGTFSPPPDAGTCSSERAARFYEVFFVLDVSTSMTRFLENGLAQQLESLAFAFPDRDSQDRRVLIDYYVIGFANDFKWFPEGPARRMTSPIAVQAAIEQAVDAGRLGNNLTQNFANAESPENLLDALHAVTEIQPQGDVVVIIVATDAEISEAPTILSSDIEVRSRYGDVREKLIDLDVQIHALTLTNLDGLTRMYKGQPPLTSGEGSRTYSLRALEESQEALQAALAEIAQTAVCN